MVFIQEAIYLKKKWGYVINFEMCKSRVTQWIALHVNSGNLTCFDSFGVKYIPKR